MKDVADENDHKKHVRRFQNVKVFESDHVSFDVAPLIDFFLRNFQFVVDFVDVGIFYKIQENELEGMSDQTKKKYIIFFFVFNNLGRWKIP